jgi:Flp pilus assembly protein TadG
VSLTSIFRRRSLSKPSFKRPVSAVLTALAGSDGAEILEFAISLPLLLVVAVGVFDFGTAFTVKQKVGNVALQGARFASNQPTTDLSLAGACGAPASVCSVRDVVESNLVGSRLNDCGLATTPGTPGTPLSAIAPLAWHFVANAGCGGTLTLTVERGFTYITTLPNPPFQAGNYTIEGTRVTLSYPYRWQFNRVVPFIAPAANYPATTQINSIAIMQNLN